MVLSKVFKLYENNQYGFAMTKPLPIGLFRKKEIYDLKQMNVIVSNYDTLKDRIVHIFIVDTEFATIDDPIKKMCNEIYT